MTILITGGAGFIGSNFIIQWFIDRTEPIINLDMLTYAGNLDNLSSIEKKSEYFFVKGSICDNNLVGSLLREYSPRVIINFAAESHVDRSIDDPSIFIQTNIIGTFTLLEEARKYWNELDGADKAAFRFLQVSTDEVYGSLSSDSALFLEDTAFAPNSPYSASKAASDHLVRAWYHTYDLPVLTTNCSNNYGPYQYPEKLIPVIISNALDGKLIPIYGDGKYIRDWLFVNDHCRAITAVIERGRIGETYNIGGINELMNINVVELICDILDEYSPRLDGNSYKKQIAFVKDRPGHDRRYAINADKILNELQWRPEETFQTGIRKTVDWYLCNQAWIKAIHAKKSDLI
jgi:dTDP-glucose 4,6-dehydratase